MPLFENTSGKLLAAGGALLSSSQGIWFGAQLPTLPLQFSTASNPPTPANTNRGSYYTPGVGGDAALTLQAAVNAAAAATGALGDVIVVQAGTVYNTSGGLTLTTRSGSGWIYIISNQAPEIGGSGLPAAGTRVGRANIPNMASLRNTAGNNYVVGRNPSTAGGSYYRLVGLDIESTDGATWQSYVCSFYGSDAAVGTQTQHTTLDRCYIAGQPSVGVVHAVGLEGMYMEITECWIENTWYLGSDSQSFLAFNSTGPYKVHNCWLEGIGEGSMFGGSDTTLPSPSEPSDITITNCHYYKPLFAGVGNFTSGSTTLTITAVTSGELTPLQNVYSAGGALTGSPYIVKQLTGTSRGVGTYQVSVAATTTVTGDTVNGQYWDHAKNAVEFKTGQRVLFDSNFLENAYGGSQQRSGFTLTARNQNGANPWYSLQDYTITNNVFANCYDGGMNLLFQDSGSSGGGGGSTQPGYRFLFRNNIFLLSQNTGTVGTTCMMPQSNAPGANFAGFGGHIIFDHNTFAAPNGMHSIVAMGGDVNTNMQLNNFVWSNNIWDVSQYRITKAGSSVVAATAYTTCIPPQVTQPVWIANVTAGMAVDTSVPAGNYSPASNAAIGYTSYGSVTAATGYQLTSASPYHGQGVNGYGLAYNAAGTPDGTDIGCNISALPTS